MVEYRRLLLIALDACQFTVSPYEQLCQANMSGAATSPPAASREDPHPNERPKRWKAPGGGEVITGAVLLVIVILWMTLFICIDRSVTREAITRAESRRASSTSRRK